MNLRTTGLLVAFVLFTSVALAQQTTITVAPRSMFAEQLADRLRAGLYRADAATIAVVVDDPGDDCAYTTQANQAQAAITITLATDGLIAICTRANDVSRQRTLGPFAALDATAVEQIATVVEASLDAISTQPAPPTNTAGNAAENVVPPVHVPTEPSTTPIADSAHAEESTPPNASDRNPVVAAQSPETSSARLYAVTLGLEPIWWVDRTFTIGGRAGIQRVIGPPWLWANLGVSYSLPFAVVIEGLGARFSTLALDLRLGFSIPLARTTHLDIALGPRVEWLFVRPFVEADSRATAGANSYAFTTASVIELGPRFAVTSHLSIALRLGAIFVTQPREYGFMHGAAFITVLDQSIPRLFAHVGAQLAL